jgi:cytidylate kinase
VTVLEKVRQYMVQLQRKLGNQPGVIELGRDITTVVLPDAKLKIYLDAPLEVRAQRRFEQNQSQGIKDPYTDVLEKIKLRDQTDKNREFGALIRAKDA